MPTGLTNSVFLPHGLRVILPESSPVHSRTITICVSDFNCLGHCIVESFHHRDRFWTWIRISISAFPLSPAFEIDFQAYICLISSEWYKELRHSFGSTQILFDSTAFLGTAPRNGGRGDKVGMDPWKTMTRLCNSFKLTVTPGYLVTLSLFSKSRIPFFEATVDYKMKTMKHTFCFPVSRFLIFIFS